VLSRDQALGHGLTPTRDSAVGVRRALGEARARHLPVARRRAVLASEIVGRNPAGWTGIPSGRTDGRRSARARGPVVASASTDSFRRHNSRPGLGQLPAGEARGPIGIHSRRAPENAHRGHGARPVADGSSADCLSWVTQAVKRRLTTAQALLAALQRRSRMPNRKIHTDLLTDVAAGVHSALEHRYLHEVESAHDLPAGNRQHARPGGNGFVDVSYVRFALVVELDGRIGHVGRAVPGPPPGQQPHPVRSADAALRLARGRRAALLGRAGTGGGADRTWVGGLPRPVPAMPVICWRAVPVMSGARGAVPCR